ncbi:uncharacterized protein LOC143917669 [Arctopsyche grandis]|uniref:uncharacterized protein LOC143917669 n=1 Tax=Arctopsyche grandis TaxID=121162 RepID=UPI00406D84FB
MHPKTGIIIRPRKKQSTALNYETHFSLFLSAIFGGQIKAKFKRRKTAEPPKNYNVTRVVDIVERVKRLKLQWAGYVTREMDEMWTKEVLEWYLTESKTFSPINCVPWEIIESKNLKKRTPTYYKERYHFRSA